MKEELLKKLQELQLKYINLVDIQICTRKDMKKIQITYCNYTENFESKSKLYIHNLDWDKDNTTKLEIIKNDIKYLISKYK